MKDLLTLVQNYATAHGAAERHRALLEFLVDDKDDFFANKIAEYELAATTYHAQLMTAYDELTPTTVRAIPDERLPVCTWQTGTVEARAVLPDHSRSVRVRYTPEQAIAAGTALIACAAVADGQTGGTLTPILPAFPTEPSPAASTDAGPTTEGTPRTMTDHSSLSDEPRHREGQHALNAPRLLVALTLIGDLDPVIADVLRNLHLRVYPGQPDEGHRSDYIVLDLHGVSIGAQRREHDVYLHADTTETHDRIIAFEVNGSGEHDHPTRTPR